MVDLEIAVGNLAVCHGTTDDISRDGLLVRLDEGCSAPPNETRVILNFKIWTGRERLCRAVNATVVRISEDGVGLKFDEKDPMTQAAVQDLLFYLQFDQRHGSTASESSAA